MSPLRRNASPQKATLIVGGTGKTGRRVAERLWDRGVPVRIGSRSTLRCKTEFGVWSCCPAGERRRLSGASNCCSSLGLTWTILRSSWLCQNFSESYLLDGVLHSEVALPAGTVGYRLRRGPEGCAAVLGVIARTPSVRSNPAGARDDCIASTTPHYASTAA